MTEAIIQIQDLEKRFRSKNTEVYALQGINLTIRKGDIFGIIGKSGAGKSTLVRCINMLERPTGGSVMFEGRDMCRLGSRDLQIARRSMGMIFQQFNLLMQRTAEENICFPLELAGVKKDAARERARELLELVNLSDGHSPTRRSFRAGKSSASPSPALWLPTPRSSCATRPLPPSTPPLRNPSFRSSRTSTGVWGSPPSSSRTK